MEIRSSSGRETPAGRERERDISQQHIGTKQESQERDGAVPYGSLRGNFWYKIAMFSNFSVASKYGVLTSSQVASPQTPGEVAIYTPSSAAVQPTEGSSTGPFVGNLPWVQCLSFLELQGMKWLDCSLEVACLSKNRQYPFGLSTIGRKQKCFW